MRLLTTVLLGGDVEILPDCRGWEGGTVIFLEVPDAVCPDSGSLPD